MSINIEELRKDLQQRLENIKIEEVEITDTSYMNDVQVGIIDTRNPIKPRETYSNDLEGELLQRFDETKDYEERLKLAEQIRQERERKLIEKAKKEQKEEKESAVKSEFISELKDKQNKISEQIYKNDTLIKNKEAELKKILDTEKTLAEISSKYEKITIHGVKNTESKAYTAINEERNENKGKMALAKLIIAKLKNGKKNLEADFNSLDNYIKELSMEEKENIEPEEDKKEEVLAEKKNEEIPEKAEEQEPEQAPEMKTPEENKEVENQEKEPKAETPEKIK